MFRHTHAIAGLVCAASAVAVAGLFSPGATAAVITQTATLAPTTTDFNSTEVTPLVFQKFDPAAYSSAKGNAVLDSVSLKFSADVQNQFSMTFLNPATITESFKGSERRRGGVGPTITLFQPNGTSPLLTAREPNVPLALTRSVTYGGKDGQTLPQTFSSSLPESSPFYIKPASATANGTKTLTSAADLALFFRSSTGPNTLSLPISASAFTTITSSSGNGAGAVSTMGKASATESYTYHLVAPAPQTGIPSPAPEPATLLLWGAAGAALVAAKRSRRVRVAG